MKISKNESLDLFADILTITLGVTMLFALLTALTGTVSHLFPDELRDHEIQTRLLEHQLANIERKRIDQATSNEARASRVGAAFGRDPAVVLEEAERRLLSEAIAAAEGQLGEIGGSGQALSLGRAALLRENQRLILDILRLESTEEVIQSRTVFLEKQIARSLHSIEETNSANLRFLREDRNRPRGQPFYIVCQYDKMYPLFQVTNGRLFRNDSGIGWTHRSGTGQLRAYPSRRDGLFHAEALDYIRKLPEMLENFPNHYPVLFVYGDSFYLARDALKILIESGMDFSWLPLAPEAGLIFSSGGLPPPPPL